MLPKDARTLLKVPQEVLCVRKCGGTYYYFGLESGFKNNFTGSEREILLSFSIDRLPLFKSSYTQIWPILCEIEGPMARLSQAHILQISEKLIEFRN